MRKMQNFTVHIVENKTLPKFKTMYRYQQQVFRFFGSDQNEETLVFLMGLFFPTENTF
jgi:hypothetical protein